MGFTQLSNESRCNGCTHGKLCIHRVKYEEVLEEIMNIKHDNSPFSILLQCPHFEQVVINPRADYIK